MEDARWKDVFTAEPEELMRRMLAKSPVAHAVMRQYTRDGVLNATPELGMRIAYALHLQHEDMLQQLVKEMSTRPVGIVAKVEPCPMKPVCDGGSGDCADCSSAAGT
jgi:hypothetical protein